MLEWVEAHIDSKLVFLLTLNVFLLIVGCLMDIFSATVVVVPLIVPLGAWVLRRTLRGVVGTDGALRVVGALSLGARERVLLLQVGSRQLLLGVSPGRIQTLYVLEDPLEVPATERRAGRDFAAHLSGLLTRVQREDRHEPRP